MRKGGVFFDRYGELRIGWCALALVAFLVLFFGGIIGFVTIGNGIVCERQREQRGLDGYSGGWQDETCYVVTEDGSVTPIDQHDPKRVEVLP